MSKIVWIISGPSVVGKSHFITKKSDRLSEIVDYRTHDLETFDPVDGDEFNFLKKNESVFLYHIDLLELDEKDNKRYSLKNLFSIPFEKKVIILGVPYNEYKERFQTLRKIDVRKSSKIKNRYWIHKTYVEWVDKLKEKNIPYIFVEAKNEYKILEEKEFFKMISYE